MSVPHRSESRLLVRLGESIRTERNPIRAACLRAEWAGIQARQGREDVARTELAALRQEFANRPQVEVSVWLGIAEGWLAHSTGMSASAHDKLKRSAALSKAAGLSRLEALSSAWLAHLELLQDHVEKMISLLEQAFSLSGPDDHSVRSRASLVVAGAYHFAARLDLASPWYSKARAHAMKEGDDAMLSALTYNMAGYHADHALRASVFGGAAKEMGSRATAVTEAADNFEQFVGGLAQDALVPIVRAMAASASGDYLTALTLYVNHRENAGRQGMVNMQSLFFAETAWCKANVDDPMGAKQDALEAIRLLTNSPVDELAVTHGRLAQTFSLLGDLDTATTHQEIAQLNWRAYQLMREKMLRLLGQAKFASE